MASKARNLEHALAVAAVVYVRSRQLRAATVKELNAHRTSDEKWCANDGIPSRSRLDLDFTPECFRTNKPESEWCTWCREHGRIWKERQRAARNVTTALNRLNRLANQAMELQAL